MFYLYNLFFFLLKEITWNTSQLSGSLPLLFALLFLFIIIIIFNLFSPTADYISLLQRAMFIGPVLVSAPAFLLPLFLFNISFTFNRLQTRERFSIQQFVSLSSLLLLLSLELVQQFDAY